MLLLLDWCGLLACPHYLGSVMLTNYLQETKAFKCLLELSFCCVGTANWILSSVLWTLLADSTAHHHQIIMALWSHKSSSLASSPSESVGVCRKRQIERHTLELEAFCDSRRQYLHYQPVKKSSLSACQSKMILWEWECNTTSQLPWPKTLPAIDLLW